MIENSTIVCPYHDAGDDGFFPTRSRSRLNLERMKFYQPLVVIRSTVGLRVCSYFGPLQRARLLAITVAVVACLPALVFAQVPESDDSSAAEKLKSWQSNGLPLMQAYCADCHNEDLQEGDLNLSPFETLDDLSESEIKRVIEMVRFGAMPPEDYDVPDTKERKQLVAALESVIFSTDCDLRPHSGRVTVRRLNRNEYDNSSS